jgi:hypothetical protein
MATLSGGSVREGFVTLCLHCFLEQALQESGDLVEPVSGACSGAYNALMVSVLELVQPCVVLRSCAEHSRMLRSRRSAISREIGRARRRGEHNW